MMNNREWKKRKAQEHNEAYEQAKKKHNSFTGRTKRIASRAVRRMIAMATGYGGV